MRRSSDVEERLRRAQDLGIETCGRIARFWGFTRTMGRTFGLLYLSPEPLTQSEIQRRLGISTGSASMTLAALLRWSVVHKIKGTPPGSRRDHYQAETDFWKMISGVLNQRERREIRAAIDTVTRAEAEARGVGRDARHVATRLAHLLEICTLGEAMLDTLLGQLTLDVARFRDALRV